MKTLKAILLALAITLGMTGCEPPNDPRGWEYKSELTDAQEAGALVTKYTQQGWQYVSMAAASRTRSGNEAPSVVVLFKRHQQPAFGTNRPGVDKQLTTKLRQGLVACWSFEGDGKDSIGQHHLDIAEGGEGPVSLDYPSGKLGQAMSQSGNIAAFSLPSIPEVNCNQDFTLSVWLYREQSRYDNDAVFDNGSVYLAKRDESPWNSRMGVYVTSKDGERLDLIDNSPMGPPRQHGWFHVVVYRSGKVLAIKVNNEGSATLDVSNLDLQGEPITYVARQKHGYPWQGRIDELCLWNRALTESERAALYNEGTGRRAY